MKLNTNKISLKGYQSLIILMGAIKKKFIKIINNMEYQYTMIQTENKQWVSMRMEN